MNEEFEKWFRAEVVAERMYPADEEGARAAWQESRKQALGDAVVALIACELGGLRVGDAIEVIRGLQKE